MDDYNFFGGHAYFGSPLGGLHTYHLTLYQRFCIRYVVVAPPYKNIS
jgi:hypothetical protein